MPPSLRPSIPLLQDCCVRALAEPTLKNFAFFSALRRASGAGALRRMARHGRRSQALTPQVDGRGGTSTYSWHIKRQRLQHHMRLLAWRRLLRDTRSPPWRLPPGAPPLSAVTAGRDAFAITGAGRMTAYLLPELTQDEHAAGAPALLPLYHLINYLPVTRLLPHRAMAGGRTAARCAAPRNHIPPPSLGNLPRLLRSRAWRKRAHTRYRSRTANCLPRHSLRLRLFNAAAAVAHIAHHRRLLGDAGTILGDALVPYWRKI